MVRCAITDSVQAAADRVSQRKALLECTRRWAVDGIELIQLREKHLDAGELLQLAKEMLGIVRAHGNGGTKLLINGRADVAIAAKADGVHLTAAPGELTPEQVRTLFAQAGGPAAVISISCHSLDDVNRARDAQSDLVLFGPVFEKRLGGMAVKDGVGIQLLREACEAARPIPLLALGGITSANTAQCLHAGAAGVAGIRLFDGASESLIGRRAV